MQCTIIVIKNKEILTGKEQNYLVSTLLLGKSPLPSLTEWCHCEVGSHKLVCIWE